MASSSSARKREPPQPKIAPHKARQASAADVQRAARGQWRRQDIIDSDGTLLGELVWDPEKQQINAHCCQAEHQTASSSSSTRGTCHMDRTTAANPSRPGQGRPLGLLIAWLRAGATCATKEEHQRAKVRLGSRAGHAERVAARQWLKEQGAFRELFLHERQKGDEEVASEPEHLP